jgi:hypothetical protein
MRTESFGTELIERYLRTRGRRYFRGQHDGEYFFILAVDNERLHVHLEICHAHRDTFTIKVFPGYFFPVAQRDRLTRLADRCNRHSRWAKAIVHESSDPNRVGVLAENSYPIARNIHFEEFASLVDHTIGSAINLFGELACVAPSPRTPEAWLPDAG